MDYSEPPRAAPPLPSEDPPSRGRRVEMEMWKRYIGRTQKTENKVQRRGWGRGVGIEMRFYQKYTPSTPRGSRWLGSGKRWKISEIGLAIPLQACPDMGLYCSFAFIAFDYKLARDGLFVGRRAFTPRTLKSLSYARVQLSTVISRRKSIDRSWSSGVSDYREIVNAVGG